MSDNTKPLYQSSVDKYDYLIVFEKNSNSKIHTPKNNFEEAKKIWLDIVPGSDEDSEKTEVMTLAGFKRLWERLTKDVSIDTIETQNNEENKELDPEIWREIVRSSVVEQLSMRCGLHLNVLTKKDLIFCRLRAPIKLLEAEAKREGYRLSFRGEIDPGSAFWHKETNGVAKELEEEGIKLSKEDANKTLAKFHLAGLVSAAEHSVNIHKETMSSWSRRVHALERIANKTISYNTYPAYAPFTSKPQLRYLYQTYPGVRGRTIFRAKDRLYLTKAIVDRHFDLDRLVQKGLVKTYMALHDANRGEKLTIDVLKRRWVWFWSGSNKEVGAPMVTSAAYEEDVSISLFLRPFSQPLIDIHAYFGEKLALHYAWLGCYTYTMLAPAVLAAACETYYQNVHYSEDDEDVVDVFQIIFLLAVVVWAVVFREFWRLEERAIALKWGTHGFQKVEKDRPKFPGEDSVPRMRSVVNNKKRWSYPLWLRRRQYISFLVVSLAVAAQVAVVVAVYVLEYHLTHQLGFAWGPTACSFLSAAQILAFSSLFGMLADALSDWENHRTQTAYEDSRILKTFSFELFNSFAALLYTCFFKGNVVHGCTNGDCIHDLQRSLQSIYGLRYFSHLWSIRLGSLIAQWLAELWSWLIKMGRKALVRLRLRDEDTKLDEKVLPAPGQQFVVEHEALSPDRGTYSKYADVVLQYGYLVLFGSAYPLIFVLSLVDNLILIRVGAFVQCTSTQRPDVYRAEDVGAWGDFMDGISVLGIGCNVAIFCFTGKSIASLSLLDKLLVLLVASQAMLMFKYFLHVVIKSNVPEWISDVKDRQKFIVDKYLHNRLDNDNLSPEKSKGLAESGYRGIGDSKYFNAQALGDSTDVEGLTLYDFRAEKMDKREKQLMHKLEAERRIVQVKLDRSRQQLKRAESDSSGGSVPLGNFSAAGIGTLEVQVEALESDTLLPSDNPLVKVGLKDSNKSNFALSEMRSSETVPTKAAGKTSVHFAPFPSDAGCLRPIEAIPSAESEVLFVVAGGEDWPFGSGESSDSVSASYSLSLHTVDELLKREIDSASIFDQKPHRVTLKLSTDSNARDANTSQKVSVSLSVMLTFRYSSDVMKYRQEVNRFSSELVAVERELCSLKVGPQTSRS